MISQAEAARRALLAAEEDRQWALVEAAAAEASERARAEFRERRARELLQAATDACTRRLPPELANIPTAAAAPGVFAWGGPVRAGSRVLFAYNCGGGPLGFTKEAKLHLGADNWRGKQKTVRGRARAARARGG